VAKGNCIWNFLSDNVLNANDGDESISSLLDIVEVISFTNSVVFRTAFILFEVLVGE